MRSFANVELVRLAIETRKDQIERLNWMVRPKLNRKKRTDAEERVSKCERLFRKPDGVTPFAAWLRPLIEDSGVTLCMELLNSKVNHPDYMCDHTAWGVQVLEAVGSPSIKLLYDIYHMQIMEGDLIATIQANSKWMGHFHTGGVPGRHELNDTQEVNWAGVMRGIAATGYKGYVAHEFVPTGDPLTSLRQAVDLCDI